MTNYRRNLVRQWNAVMRNPTARGVMAVWPKHLPKPESDLIALIGIHKARVHWIHATPAMITESVEWLKAHGQDTSVASAFDTIKA